MKCTKILLNGRALWLVEGELSDGSIIGDIGWPIVRHPEDVETSEPYAHMTPDGHVYTDEVQDAEVVQ